MTEDSRRRLQILEPSGAIERLCGDAALYAHLCRTFMDAAPQRLETLRLAVEAGDLRAVARAAHAIRGGGLTIGAERLAAVLRDMETLAGDTDVERAAYLLADTADELLLLSECLRDHDLGGTGQPRG